MYKQAFQTWFKHIDFLLLDELSLWVSLLAAASIGRRVGETVEDSNPLGLLILLLVINLSCCIAFGTLRNVRQRRYLAEAGITIRHVIFLFGFAILCQLVRAESVSIPRLVFAWAVILYTLLSYGTRVAWKFVLRRFAMGGDRQRSILIVTEEKLASGILKRMRQYSQDEYRVAGFVFIDRDAKGASVDGVPVVANLSDAAEYICRTWMDEVFFFHASLDERSRNLIDRCREMAVTLHLYIAVQGVDESRQTIESIAGYNVLTANIRLVSARAALFKRAADFLVGIVGSLLALIAIAVFGPMIYIASPGPLIFVQERVGENGRRFKMYKLRSMYMDADARKAELERQNSHSDGMLFKMDFDPRVIGNRILPDGRQVKGIGDFIRKTSVDELPQFFNVLKGEMSVVGTRPPTVDEWEKYQFHHRARMAVRPGMTGLWQINPRKDEMDFDEVVQLDTEYIANWNLGRDIKIVWRTAKNVLRNVV